MIKGIGIQEGDKHYSSQATSHHDTCDVRAIPIMTPSQHFLIGKASCPFYLVASCIHVANLLYFINS
jgi:hypothetical protein